MRKYACEEGEPLPPRLSSAPAIGERNQIQSDRETRKFCGANLSDVCRVYGDIPQKARA